MVLDSSQKLRIGKRIRFGGSHAGPLSIRTHTGSGAGLSDTNYRQDAAAIFSTRYCVCSLLLYVISFQGKVHVIWGHWGDGGCCGEGME